MNFWKTAYDRGWISPNKDIAAIKLRIMVLSESNPYGEITAEDYKTITNIDF